MRKFLFLFILLCVFGAILVSDNYLAYEATATACGVMASICFVVVFNKLESGKSIRRNGTVDLLLYLVLGFAFLFLLVLRSVIVDHYSQPDIESSIPGQYPEGYTGDCTGCEVVSGVVLNSYYDIFLEYVVNPIKD